MVGSGRKIRRAMLGTQHRIVANLLHVHAGAMRGHCLHPLGRLFQWTRVGRHRDLLEQQAQHQQQEDSATVAAGT